jgi:TPP-dependent 2-oxoacid decarboxylase
MTSIKIGDYILRRLKEVGVDTVFGVPGDYNMVSLLYPCLKTDH